MAHTIAAISTAPVRSAIGVIRVSGDTALTVVSRVFSGCLSHRPREMVTGHMTTASGEVCDYGMGVYFKGPASYTGEDTVELYCHGSLAVLRSVLDALYTAGATPAEPGEFTRRAFLNGKIDLTQAEAVIDLIDSETTLAAKNAAEQINGAIGAEITSLSKNLTAIAAEFYAFVDYPDDDIPDIDRHSLTARLRSEAKRATELSESYTNGRIVRQGVKCALIGKPNVGKSSILNKLLKSERSIVTDTAGTTRDTIEESMMINSLAVHLIDTAGIREADEEIERLGIERSEASASDADLILAVFDGSQELEPDDMRVLEISKNARSLVVINKCDLKQKLNTSVFGDTQTLKICAKSGDGIAELCERIFDIFGAADIPCDGKTVTNPRHASTLRRASERISAAADAFDAGLTPDVAVIDIESAINTLGELTGATAADEVLREIFSRFCVGK